MQAFDVAIVYPYNGSVMAKRKIASAFTFLEIVAALAVLAIGILAVITLFPIGLENSKRASERTRAALLVYQQLQRYRAWGHVYVTSMAQGTYQSFSGEDPNFSYFLQWTKVTPYAGATPGTALQEVTITAVWPSTQPASKRRTLTMSTLIGER